MDLSNARIIEWEHGGETYVASRRVKGQVFGFIAPTGAVRTATELSLQNPASEVMNLRVVAEFPAPSLAEIVGDAPAFVFEHRDYSGQAGQCIAWWGGDGWMWARRMFYGGDSTPSRLDQVPVGDLSSVVPLVPREAKP